jgi:YD repeat-containing protein
MSPVRLAVRATLIVLIAAAALFVVAEYVGSFASGAMALARLAPGARSVSPLGLAYRALHKGHIDMATGLYEREDEDVVLRAAPSFILRRTYRTQDRQSRAFGVGASHTGDWYLIGDGSTFQWAELILEDGASIHYDRVSSGTSFFNARFEHWTTPTRFYGSQLAWHGTDWIIRERDGTLLTFLSCSPQHGPCALASIRQRDGLTIRFRRDETARLTRIDAGRQWIAFEYGDGGRIAQARDHAGHAVAYTYDPRGRLRQALDTDGTKRTYDYDDRDRLIRIEEPGRIVENRYDTADMCVWQRVRFPADPAHGALSEDEPYVFTSAYKMEDGRVRYIDTSETNAPPLRTAFNARGYVASETWDVDTDRAKTIAYDRSPETGLLIGMTLTCAGGRWHTSRTVSASPATEERAEQELLATPCVSRE